MKAVLLEAVGTVSGGQTPWWEWVLIVAAVVVGALAAVLVIRKLKGPGSLESDGVHKGILKPWDELQQSQINKDILDGRTLAAWIEENKSNMKPGMRILVAKTTKKWVTMMGYTYPKGLDPEHNVIVCMVDANGDKVLYPQLFSFSETDDVIKKYFGENQNFYLEA